MLHLPFPAKELNPNYTKCHYHQKAKIKKKTREAAFVLAKGTRPKWLKKGETVHLDIVFHQAKKGKMDLDNCLAALKSTLDGVADAWKTDDKYFRPITIDFGEKADEAYVIIKAKKNG